MGQDSSSTGRPGVPWEFESALALPSYCPLGSAQAQNARFSATEWGEDEEAASASQYALDDFLGTSQSTAPQTEVAWIAH